MNIAELAPYKIHNMSHDLLELVATAAKEVIFGKADRAAKEHAGLILHYCREFQK